MTTTIWIKHGPVVAVGLWVAVSQQLPPHTPHLPEEPWATQVCLTPTAVLSSGVANAAGCWWVPRFSETLL